MTSSSAASRPLASVLPPASFGPGSAYPTTTVTALIEAQIARHPSAVAVRDPHAELTYAELDREASALAARLRDVGVGRGDVVGIFLQRSVSMVVGILAVLKTGAAYCPQDARISPVAQLRHIAAKAKMPVVLTTAAHRAAMPEGPVVFAIDEAADALSLAPAALGTPEDPCAVIFTSGTTGTPNGVVVTHANLVNLLSQHPGNLGITPGTTVGQILNIAFDMAAWEILGTLSNGGTLVIRGSDIAATAETVDVVIATPSIVAGLSSERARARTVAVAGERCPQPLADEWAVGRRFLNSCGPTEITIINTLVEHAPGRDMSIGTPIPGTSVYVLDEQRHPVPGGEVGEMWVGGVGVTAGYLGDQELTDARYLPDPFHPDGGRMFRTRDLGRWTSDGVLDHLGRTDDQIKVRGFRVELDSVARALERASGCEKAVVVQLDSRTLGAVITPSTADPDAARAAASAVLPYYSVPAVIRTLDALPLSPRGKVDRALLTQTLTESVSLEKAA
ncbi:amino acid adenylation domain-containing protein [Microbacterium oxydans]|uniref:amino acid adenylation domain-containing protein n=1 Tax=Microbacterium oxydans TaxID=82380 RepID=UPI00226B36D3|nr:amino acid adenylation domain-containing protein [Microbacterium oxydans]WAA65627.1 amino acid adenylation domain-containing protein [Microbacterium oxydans]